MDPPDERPVQTSALLSQLLAAELEELTHSEVIALAPTPDELNRILPPDTLARLLDRGPAVRILYPLGTEPATAPVATPAHAGAALRIEVRLPYLLVIRDRAVVYFPHRDPRHPVTQRFVRLRSVVVAGSLAAACDALWATAAQNLARTDAACGDLGAWHHEVIQVLSNGLTDDQAAVQLHMSKRTFARRVAILMDRLHANSRFQAGVQAARRGLV
jgi:hypothetical protein